MTNNATKQVSDFDWDDVRDGAQDDMPITFPVVFWRHGKQAFRNLGDKDISYTGGFFFSYGDCPEGTVIDGWKDSSFTGDEGNEVKGISTHGAHLAIVRFRRRWFRETDGRVEYRSWNNYQTGFRGHIQAVGFTRGYDEPICFSLKGMAVDYMYSILREQNSKVVAIANREAPPGKKLPLYAFWLTIRAGKHEKIGKGQKQNEVTMPQIYLPKVIDQNYLRERYIGKHNLRKFQDLYVEA